MSPIPSINNIPGRAINKNIFEKFSIKENLIIYDSPLLILAEAPDGNSWLFKWCEIVDPTSSIERWIAFEVSKPILQDLKENIISLKRAILSSKNKLYIFDARDLFNPLEIRISEVRNLPTKYLPSQDITLNGNLLKLSSNDNCLNVCITISSKNIVAGEAPFSILTPLQQILQQYLRWAVHNIAKPKKSGLSSIVGWTTLKLVSVTPGSFRINCVIDCSQGEARLLSKAWNLLAKLLINKNIDINEIKLAISDEAFLYSTLLADFVSKGDLLISIKWESSVVPISSLEIGKKEAKKFLEILSPERNRKRIRTITIKLTDEEAAPLRRQVKGSGGMQNLLRGLQAKLGRQNTINLTLDEVEKIRRYGLNYGKGGFQDRLSGIAMTLEKIYAAFQTSDL